jgi:hypothetical protein
MFAADKDISLQSNELEVRRVPQCRVPKTEKPVIPEDAMTAILQQPSNTKMGLFAVHAQSRNEGVPVADVMAQMQAV